MDPNLVYTKTPIGDEAVRQSSRVVQRNLRMVLVQVDGKLTVAELSAKIGNPRLVASALRELEEGGFIAPPLEAVTVWENESRDAREGKRRPVEVPRNNDVFSTQPLPTIMASGNSEFSSFGKPILPAYGKRSDYRDAQSNHSSGPPRFEHGRNWGRLIGLTLLVMSVVLAVVVVVFPYNIFRPNIESALGRGLQKAVHVQTVSLEFSPYPVVVLSGVRIGERSDFMVDAIRLPASPGLLLNGLQSVTKAQMSGVMLDAEALLALPLLSSPTRDLALQRLTVDKMSVRAGGLSLQALAGEVVFQSSGQVERLRLQSSDHTLRLEAVPNAAGLLLSLEGAGWQPTGNPMLVFDGFKAKATVQKGKVLIYDVDTLLLGGVLKGNLIIDWQSGLAMAGDAKVQRMDMRRLATAFEPNLPVDGEVAGSLRFRTNGQDVASLWRNLQANLTMDVMRGSVTGFDLGRMLSVGMGVGRSGTTRFDQLHGNVDINGSSLRIQNLVLDSGMLTATGDIQADNGQINGRLSVAMQTSSSRRQAGFHISGALPKLNLEMLAFPR